MFYSSFCLKGKIRISPNLPAECYLTLITLTFGRSGTKVQSVKEVEKILLDSPIYYCYFFWLGSAVIFDSFKQQILDFQVYLNSVYVCSVVKLVNFRRFRQL